MNVSWISSDKLEQWFEVESKEPAEKGQPKFSGTLLAITYDSKQDLYCVVHEARGYYPRFGWPAR